MVLSFKDIDFSSDFGGLGLASWSTRKNWAVQQRNFESFDSEPIHTDFNLAPILSELIFLQVSFLMYWSIYCHSLSNKCLGNFRNISSLENKLLSCMCWNHNLVLVLYNTNETSPKMTHSPHIKHTNVCDNFLSLVIFIEHQNKNHQLLKRMIDIFYPQPPVKVHRNCWTPFNTGCWNPQGVVNIKSTSTNQVKN